MRLIGGVKVLLHDEGQTIRAVQKTLREQGIKHVADFSPPLDTDETDGAAGEVIDAVATEAPLLPDSAAAQPAPAARGTRSAQPDPVDDDLFAGLDDTDASEELEDAEPSAAPEPEFARDELAALPDSPSASEAPAPDTEPAQNEPARDIPPASEVPPPDVPPATAEDAPIMFRRASRPAPLEEERPEAAEEAPVVAPPIPDTPDVPATDPSDADPAHAANTGVAARITAMPRTRLKAHPEALKAAHARLVQLRDRLG